MESNERWSVEYALAADVDAEFNRGVAAGEYGPDDGNMEAVMQCWAGCDFPNRGLAIAYAKRIAPKCDCGIVRIQKEERIPVAGYAGLYDWEPVGPTEEVDHTGDVYEI